jgi:hypothetical protein
VVWILAIGLMMGDILAMVSLKYENDKLKTQFGENENCPFDVSKD